MCCGKAPCDALRVALIRFSHPVFPLAAPGPLPSADNETVMRQLRINTISALVSALAVCGYRRSGGLCVHILLPDGFRRQPTRWKNRHFVARSAENYIRCRWMWLPLCRSRRRCAKPCAAARQKGLRRSWPPMRRLFPTIGLFLPLTPKAKLLPGRMPRAKAWSAATVRQDHSKAIFSGKRGLQQRRHEGH